MLSARRTNAFGSSYEVTLDGLPLTTFAASTWRAGLRFPFAGYDHELRAKLLSSRFEIYASGMIVAVARDVGRKSWTLGVDGQDHAFRRTSIWTNEHTLLQGGHPAGVVRRAGSWRTGADADLPTLPVHVQVFALAVILTLWRSADGGD